MYQSIVNENIVLSIYPMWAGELDIYSPDVKAVELGVIITNKSKKDFKINHISLRIRKWGFLFYAYDNLSIDVNDQIIAPDLRSNFIYDLKPILDLYGKQKKISFRIVGGKTRIESRPVSIKEIQTSVIAMHTRHF